MVRLYMKQEFVSVQERIIVKDETGRDIFLIAGKWGRIGDVLSLYTLDGSLLVEAKQTVLSLFPKFDLYARGKKIGSITKHRGIKQPYFKVSHLNWIVTGNFESHRYRIRHKLEPIMEMEKAYFSYGDFYSLDIANPHDAPVCLIIAVIVDHLAINRDAETAKNKVLAFTC